MLKGNRFISSIFLANICISVLCFVQLTPEKPIIDYVNDKYLKHVNVTISRRSRHSPTYVDLDVETNDCFGDNFTLEISILEELSGRWQPMAIYLKYPLCEFLKNEPVVGRMFGREIGNYTCPFPAGHYSFPKMVMALENLKVQIPFTFAFAKVKTRADLGGYLNSGKNEVIFKMRVYITMENKPNRQGKKKQPEIKAPNMNLISFV